ncbi:hypothetical protein I350_03173 [Cryptococcus amylolentus CBS 6273]|uniref:Uncharacterized protein n=1 Tax=Cryptococcus amylolentus CBS 6273 TaxID=1296118 RepID=A0A1E3K8W2_9TREE|nr:hypothetical protein I350_03173 [Cryptococcus amylolentus CBS 6273]
MSAPSSRRSSTSSHHAPPDEVGISPSLTQTNASQKAAAPTAGTPSTSERINALISRTLDIREPSMSDAEWSSNLNDILETIPVTDANRQLWRNALSGFIFDVKGEQLPHSSSLQGFGMGNNDDYVAQLRRQLMSSNMSPGNRGNGAFEFENYADFLSSSMGYNNTQRRPYGGAHASQLSEGESEGESSPKLAKDQVVGDIDSPVVLDFHWGMRRELSIQKAEEEWVDVESGDEDTGNET